MRKLNKDNQKELNHKLAPIEVAKEMKQKSKKKNLVLPTSRMISEMSGAYILHYIKSIITIFVNINIIAIVSIIPLSCKVCQIYVSRFGLVCLYTSCILST